MAGARLIAEGPYFAQLWESVLFDDRLQPSSKVLYAVIQRMQAEGGDDAMWPTQEELAQRANLGVRTVRDCLNELAAAGHIVKRRGQHGLMIVLVRPDRRNPPNSDRRNLPPDRQKAPVPSAESAGSRARDKEVLNTETTETGENPPNPPRGYPHDFEDFWKRYPPTNGSKAAAYRCWQKLKPEERTLARGNLEKWLVSEHWRRGYVRHAATWLGPQRLWEQEPVAQSRASPTPAQRGGVFSAAVEALEVGSGSERNGASPGHDRHALLGHGSRRAGAQPGADGVNVADGAGGYVDVEHRVRA